MTIAPRAAADSVVIVIGMVAVGIIPFARPVAALPWRRRRHRRWVDPVTDGVQRSQCGAVGRDAGRGEGQRRRRWVEEGLLVHYLFGRRRRVVAVNP